MRLAAMIRAAWRACAWRIARRFCWRAGMGGWWRRCTRGGGAWWQELYRRRWRRFRVGCSENARSSRRLGRRLGRRISKWRSRWWRNSGKIWARMRRYSVNAAVRRMLICGRRSGDSFGAAESIQITLTRPIVIIFATGMNFFRMAGMAASPDEWPRLLPVAREAHAALFGLSTPAAGYHHSCFWADHHARLHLLG